MTEPTKSDPKPGIASRLFSGFTRVVAAVFVALLIVAWLILGTHGRQTMLDGYYDDYVVCREAERHPIIARLVAPENAVRAAEQFAADYESLQDSNAITAPLYIWQVRQSHKRLAQALGADTGTTSPSTPPAATGDGIEVVSVTHGGNAWRAGIREGDRILAYNRYPISTVDDLKRAIANTPDDFAYGAPVTLIVERSGLRQQTKASPGLLEITARD